jgi:hypothetical protein
MLPCASVVPAAAAPKLAYTFVGASDIATSGTGDSATALLLDGIVAQDPATVVFTAGDNTNVTGSASDFANYYAPTWGRHRGRTRPAPGNHDYKTAGASGYLGYFCARPDSCVFPGGTPQRYYSYDVGSWHIVSLDSNVGFAAGSAQLQWLVADLAANRDKCIAATWHHPYYSSGEHGSTAAVRPFWEALYAAGADVVISGHDHGYERFAKQDANGNVAADGIRAFVAGTGGAALRPFATIRPNSQVRNASTYGVLKFRLKSASYSWQFVPAAGGTFTDSGSEVCNSAVRLALDRQVALGSDDAEERPTGTMSIPSGDLELVTDDAMVQTVGLRFTDIGVPRNATVTRAYIQFTAIRASTAPTVLTIRGQDADNAATFAGTAFNITSRPTTSATVAWTPKPWPYANQSSEIHRTPDIRNVLTEIISRPGWLPSNAVAFTIAGSGLRAAYSWNGSAARAARLHIDYAIPAP